MLLGLDVRAQIKDIFDKEFKEPVSIKVFSQAIGCDSCQTTEELVKELAEVAGEDRIKYEVHSPVLEKELAEQYGVDRIPTIVIEGDKDYGIRYIGLPAGLEFSTLVQGIIQVSKREPNLSEKTLELIKDVDIPIEIMVFVTTSCGYCPAAAVMAYNFALASDYITAKVVDASENQDLAEKFQVVGVPKVVINNGVAEFVGAQPENAFLGYIIATYEKLKKEGVQ
ncbi:thioredoxin family protein [Hydrogenivirga sp. 128-5-R1-1]|uniref:protein disulfide oxidoreductase n=1 Tax=Hydrogenivirga sp. 128-5-R1-1 TaxID=392423 RepID=UPI00015F15D3|nr:thioredoxin family protein [Hydrogenivirga sp. 128-5-R1-1]EDP74773.1 glutaredoxin-like protein [Hydrogenivirga sp. 128-5-R1-1]